jgi:hypothetical protein
LLLRDDRTRQQQHSSYKSVWDESCFQLFLFELQPTGKTVKTTRDEAMRIIDCFHQLLPRKPINKFVMAGLLARFFCSTPSLPYFTGEVVCSLNSCECNTIHETYSCGTAPELHRVPF